VIVGIKLYKEPELKNPIMLCGWPGIGNIGINAIDSLRVVLKAQEFGEIEPWDFFNPRKVTIEKGLLKDLEFPSSKFYFQKIRSLPVVIGLSLALTAGLVAGGKHYINYIPSPEAQWLLSKIMATMIVLSSVSVYVLLLWLLWSYWKRGRIT